MRQAFQSIILLFGILLLPAVVFGAAAEPSIEKLENISLILGVLSLVALVGLVSIGVTTGIGLILLGAILGLGAGTMSVITGRKAFKRRRKEGRSTTESWKLEAGILTGVIGFFAGVISLFLAILSL